jgi:hypothetical protein
MHAAIEAARGLQGDHPHLVLCDVEGIRLQVELERLQEFGLPCFPFYEPDLQNQLTAVAVGPLISDSERRRMRRFCLLKGVEHVV